MSGRILALIGGVVTGLALVGLAVYLVQEGWAKAELSAVTALFVAVTGVGLSIWGKALDRQSNAKEALTGRADPAKGLFIGDIPREPLAFQARNDLRDHLPKVRKTHRKVAVYSLTGQRGAGKTQLAAAYARQWRKSGRPGAWITAATTEQLLGGLSVVAAELGLSHDGEDSASAARKFRQWLEHRNDPYLVVFDNAVNPDELNTWLPSQGTARILITSNRRHFKLLGGVEVEVERFTTAEAMSYLRERLNIDDEDGARRLVGELDHLPLALALAASQINHQRLTYAAYLDRLRSVPISESLQREEGESYPRGFAETVQLSVEEIGRHPAGEARNILELLSVLAPTGVSIDVIIGQEHRPSLAALAEASIAVFSTDGSSISVHRLVQRAVRDQAWENGTLGTAISTAAERLDFIAELYRQDAWRDRVSLSSNAQHVEAVWHAVQELDARGTPAWERIAEPVLHLRLWVLRHLNAIFDVARAVGWGQALIADCERALGPDHTTTLNSRSALAYSYDLAERKSEAISLSESTLALRERIQGENHLDTVVSRINLGSIYRSVGRAREAIVLYERAVATLNETFGRHHADTLTALNGLGIAYEAAGRNEEAIDLHKEVLAIRERDLGDVHADTLTSRGNLASAYEAAGRLDQAISLYEQTSSERARTLGEDHPRTLVLRSHLAGAYRRAGRVEDAITLHTRNLDVRQQEFGANHPDTAREQYRLARAYEAAGQTRRAEALYERALDTFARLPDPGNPFTEMVRSHLERIRGGSAEG